MTVGTANVPPRPRSPLREAAKVVLRGYGVATSPLRRLPDFLVIGAKRGGTTSFFRTLQGLTGVLPLFPARQRIKGVHFFDANFHRGTHWYRSFFPRAGRPGVAGEATPYYLAHPRAAARARRVIPGARVIVLLRDPVDRAYSHYLERVRNGTETLAFAEAIEEEGSRLREPLARMRREPRFVSFEHEHHSYLTQGRYAELLTPWMSAFPPDQLLILRSDDLYARPEAVFERVSDHLGLPRQPIGELPALNRHPYEPMDPDTRAWLCRYYAPLNRRLEEMLGWDLRGWAS